MRQVNCLLESGTMVDIVATTSPSTWTSSSSSSLVDEKSEAKMMSLGWGDFPLLLGPGWNECSPTSSMHNSDPRSLNSDSLTSFLEEDNCSMASDQRPPSTMTETTDGSSEMDDDEDDDEVKETSQPTLLPWFASTSAMSTDNQRARRRRVHFGTISVREYALVLGDHPWADSYPLSLDWSHADTQTWPLDEYEQNHHQQQPHWLSMLHSHLATPNATNATSSSRRVPSFVARRTFHPPRRLTEFQRCARLQAVTGLASTKLAVMEQERVYALVADRIAAANYARSSKMEGPSSSSTALSSSSGTSTFSPSSAVPVQDEYTMAASSLPRAMTMDFSHPPSPEATQPTQSSSSSSSSLSSLVQRMLRNPSLVDLGRPFLELERLDLDS